MAQAAIPLGDVDPDLELFRPGAGVTLLRELHYDAEILAADGRILRLRVRGEPCVAGERMLLRVPEASGRVYLVEAEVMEVDERAVHEAVVQIASEVRREQERRHARVVALDADILVREAEDEAEVSPASCRDISAGGMRFVVDRSYRVGSVLVVQVTLPDRDAPVTFEGRASIAWGSASGSSGPRTYGVRFEGLPEQVEDAVSAWVLRQQARRRS